MLTRDALGQIVREAWVTWAKEQESPKPAWLVPWENLDESQREVDRRIGEAVVRALAPMEREEERSASPFFPMRGSSPICYTIVADSTREHFYPLWWNREKEGSLQYFFILGERLSFETPIEAQRFVESEPVEYGWLDS